MATEIRMPVIGLARIWAAMLPPEMWDAPPHSGDPSSLDSQTLRLRPYLDPRPVPWLRTGWAKIGDEVSLNPQPIPPGWTYAVAVANAKLDQLMHVEQIAQAFPREAERIRALGRQQVEDDGEICPQWPIPPIGWPPFPPGPDPGPEPPIMLRHELFALGSVYVLGAGQLESAELREAVTGLGEKAINKAIGR
ncbi:MAG: hypothetical protein QM753_10810 [Thermomicrobiales bacterium]